VESLRPPPTHDPELDPPPRRPTTPGPARPPFSPQEYQRLVANPFLAVLGLIVWVVAMRQALALRNLAVVLLTLLGLVALGYLLQYHCLDCGATGLLSRWKSHACERVRARQQFDQVRRFRGPNPVFQTVLWGYLLAVLAILAAAVLLQYR
jgi:hypothetical protein